MGECPDQGLRDRVLGVLTRPASRHAGEPLRDTGPEMAIRRLLHAMGLRYRVDARPVKEVRCRADIVFGPTQVAVFVDGSFWHCCPQHCSIPKSNADYWTPKLQGNVERDQETNSLLGLAGWKVIRVWEH